LIEDTLHLRGSPYRLTLSCNPWKEHCVLPPLRVGLFPRHPHPVTFPPPGGGKRGVAVIGGGWR
jgi:hypothetical protein